MFTKTKDPLTGDEDNLVLESLKCVAGDVDFRHVVMMMDRSGEGVLRALHNVTSNVDGCIAGRMSGIYRCWWW